jgi:hypothetical protein
MNWRTVAIVQLFPLKKKVPFAPAATRAMEESAEASERCQHERERQPAPYPQCQPSVPLRGKISVYGHTKHKKARKEEEQKSITFVAFCAFCGNLGCG